MTTHAWNTDNPDQYPSLTLTAEGAIFRPYDGCMIAANTHHIEVAIPNGQITADQACLLGDALAQAATVKDSK